MTTHAHVKCWATLVASAVLLTGCAGGSPPGSPGGDPTSVPAREEIATAPVVPHPITTTVPVVAPPPEFVDRANLVADAVRRAGLPKGATAPVLRSWAIDEGFETDVQKEAWGHGHVEFVPGVDTTRTGDSGTLQLSDGSTRPVGVIGVRAALDRALDGALDAPTSCDSIPAADCRIVVSQAVLTRASVETSGGAVALPVWQLTLDGLSHTISVIAVADGAVVRPQPPPPLPGLPDPPLGFRGADSLKRVDGSTVVVGIGNGACDPNLAAHVVEFDDLVVVGATADLPPADTVCPAVYVSTPAELRLARPLGARVVIDVVTGTPRFLGMPPS